MADERPSEPDASDDDAAWIAALRGHPAEGTASPAAMEASMLREAMLKWPPAVDALPVQDPARIARLLERARAEGLLGEPSEPDLGRRVPPGRGRTTADTPITWWARIRAGGFGGARASLAAAAVLLVATGVWLARPDRSPVDEGSVRATPDAVVVLRVADPDAARRELVDGLAAEGVKMTRYTRFGRLGVDADLPRPLSAGILGVLQRQGIAPPSDGVLRVEYEGPSP